MRIAILGPVRLAIDGEPVRLGRMLRRVLTALALARGRPVSIEQLMALLWPDEQPSQSRRVTARSHIAHLRQRLDPGSGADSAVLVTDDLGYRLVLGPDDDLDVDRFERIAAQAKRAGHDGDPERAAQLAVSALVEWHGPPGSDGANGQFETAETRRLEALRADVLELRIESDLALGRHEELVVELKELVQSSPDREQLHRFLVLALYRSGRRGEALAAYEPGKRALQGHGKDHVHLEALRRQVLVESPELAWFPRAVVIPRGPVQPPRDIRNFVGRAQEIAELIDLLDAPTTGSAPLVIGLFGMPGIGKTAVVNHLANLVADRFDVILTARLDAYGPSPYDAIHELLSFLRLLRPDLQVPREVREASNQFSVLLRGRRTLVVVDDAASAAEVEPLIPVGSGNVVFVTSRKPLTDLDGVVAMRLDVLDATEAVALLATFGNGRRIAAEPEAAARLVEYCGGMPLALRLVGAMLQNQRAWSLERFHDWLIAQPAPLQTIKIGDRTLAKSIHRSYVMLPPHHARLFRLLGALRTDDVSVEVAAALVDAPATHVEGWLMDLATAQLIDSPAPLRFRLHHIVQLFATQEQDADDEPTAPAVDRVLDFYLGRLQAMDAVLFPDADAADLPGQRGNGPFLSAPDATSWLASELRNLIAFSGQADIVNRDKGARFVIRMNWLLRRYFDLRSSWSEWTVTARAARKGARHLGDEREEGYALRDTGIVAARHGEFARAAAAFKDAGQLLRSAGDAFGEAAVVNNGALVNLLVGNVADAIPMLVRAGELFGALGDLASIRVVTLNLGEACRRQGDMDEAEKHLERALVLSRTTHGLVDEGKSLHNLGELHRERGDADLAEDFYRRSLLVFDRSGDDHTRALTFYGLGALAADADDIGQAQGLMSQALEILDRLGSADADQVRTHLSRLGRPG